MVILKLLTILIATYLTNGFADSVLSAQELFCEDPDTGILHKVNATWSSTTFCGNYTCKFRKKNKTAMQYNNTSNNFNKTRKSPNVADLRNALEKVNFTNKNNSPNNNNRYLTEEEIQTIIHLLHTVKKSDLNAILEMYDIAKNIYHEMDKSASNNFDPKYNAKAQDSMPIRKNRYKKTSPLSYWYEPIMNYDTYHQVLPAKVLRSNVIPRNSVPNRYFKSSYIGQDSRSQPHYYPMTAYQKLYLTNNRYYPSAPRSEAENNYYKHCTRNEVLKPNTLITYSTLANQYMNTPDKIFMDAPNVNPHQNLKITIPMQNELSPYDYGASSIISKITNNPTNIPYRQSEKPTIKQDVYQGTTKSDLAKWSELVTAQLVDEKGIKLDRPKFTVKPHQKIIKLEKIAKVTRLDEKMRNKRKIRMSPSQIAEFELYLDVIRCLDDVEPGFFQLGNLTQPYPHCCPQKIQKLRK